MRRWMWWLMPPWGREVRRRQAVEVLSEQEERERAAARARITAEASRWC